MKKITLLILVLIVADGCAPKRGEIYSMQETPSKTTAKITVMRNSNIFGSAIRYYPTVDGKKVAGLYTKEHVVFYLPENTYRIGIKFPLVGSNAWKEDELTKKIEASRQYYFLLSPTFGGVEIEEVNKKQAQKQLVGSVPIKTGHASSNTDAATIIFAPFKFIGLGEDESE